MTNETEKNYDFNKLLSLFDQEKLREIGIQLASEAFEAKPIQYTEYQIKLKVPNTVVQLLESLTEIFPIDLNTVLSSMASQGLSRILQTAITLPETQKSDIPPIEDIEQVTKITDQLSDLQNVINRFTDMQQLFQGFVNETSVNTSEQDKENSE